LRVSSFYQEKVVSYKFLSEFLTRSSNSRTQKNSPTGSTKDGALMVGGMFVVTTMSCRGKKFIEIGTGSGLLGTIP